MYFKLNGNVDIKFHTIFEYTNFQLLFIFDYNTLIKFKLSALNN